MPSEMSKENVFISIFRGETMFVEDIELSEEEFDELLDDEELCEEFFKQL